MKKVLVFAAVLVAAVCSAKAEVKFGYDAGAEIVSAYIWRGQYNGGLSFQPDLEIGFDSEHMSLRVGVPRMISTPTRILYRKWTSSVIYRSSVQPSVSTIISILTVIPS